MTISRKKVKDGLRYEGSDATGPTSDVGKHSLLREESFSSSDTRQSTVCYDSLFQPPECTGLKD